jgi:hypothetical protein
MKIGFDCNQSDSACHISYWQANHSQDEQHLYLADGRLPNENGQIVAGTYLVRLCKWQVEHAESQMWYNLKPADHLCPQCGEEHQ